MGDGALRRNTAGWDRAIRLLVAAVLLLAVPTGVANPWWSALAGVFAGLQLVAGVTGY